MPHPCSTFPHTRDEEWGRHMLHNDLTVLPRLLDSQFPFESVRIGCRDHLDHLEKFITEYEKFCKKVAKEHDKDFDFPKQHATSHVIHDIRSKGALYNFSARPGEGFQQEASQAYRQTNGKEAERQMVRIDEKQETVARIQLEIDTSDTAIRERQLEAEFLDAAPADADDTASQQPLASTDHWAFGSPGQLVDPSLFQETQRLQNCGAQYRNFPSRLTSFLSELWGYTSLIRSEEVTLRPFKCLYVDYQSLEDWTSARDILRCNESFWGERRFDCVMFNVEDEDLSVARLLHLIRCKHRSGRITDIALVHRFIPTKWRPRTFWSGCIVLEEQQEISFLSMEHVIRDAWLCPAFEYPRNKSYHYVMDKAGSDIFLRVNKLQEF